MQGYDPKKAARVWNRVRSTQPEHQSIDIDPMITAAGVNAAIYLRLSRQELSSESAILKKLAEEKLAQASCLKGIRRLTAGRIAGIPLPQPAKEAPFQALRRCYHSEIHALRELELRTADRDFGPVYGELAQHQRHLCRILLELIGRLER